MDVMLKNQQADKQFAELFAEAEEDANDTIDDEIVRRAIEGIEEPLVSLGRVVYDEEPVLDEGGNEVLDKNGNPKMRRGAKVMVARRSDSLILALAKSRMPKYRDKGQLAITGKDEGPLDVVVETFWGRGTDPRNKLPAPEPVEETDKEDLGEDDEDSEFGIDVPDDDDDDSWQDDE